MKGIYVPIFQEFGPHLERQLESFATWNIKNVYYVDGPFPGFPHTDIKSTDGTRELIKSYGYTIIDSGENYMPIKSNLAYHAAARDGVEGLLIVGADEYLEGDLNSIEVPKSPIARVHLVEHNPTGKYNRVEDVNPRLICWPGLVRDVNIHWMHFFMNEMIDDNLMPIVEGITIHCDDLFRPKERDDQMTTWQDGNVIREKKIINEKYIKQIIDSEFPPVRSLTGTLYWTCGCITQNDGNRLKKCDKHKNKSPKL